MGYWSMGRIQGQVIDADECYIMRGIFIVYWCWWDYKTCMYGTHMVLVWYIVANVGGTLGLCIGASLLTVFEFCEFGILSLIRCMKSTRSRNSTSTRGSQVKVKVAADDKLVRYWRRYNITSSVAAVVSLSMSWQTNCLTNLYMEEGSWKYKTLQLVWLLFVF